MFDVTADDIALLGDEDLRALVGLLCEAEMRRCGHSVAAVLCSGHQNAGDGGVDVRVSLPIDAAIGGFVPRPMTGFQVKSSDMSRSEIINEMRPKGILRGAIVDLANRSGAYILVSSAGSVSDDALQRRRDAMREALGNLPSAAALTSDFYDRGRMATWVRDHIGLIPWVRAKNGTSIPGWRPYEAWAYDPRGLVGEYLVDEKANIVANHPTPGKTVPVIEGIGLIRSQLRKPREIVRLVGLSGLGKTRLVQALFDSRVGTDALDPSLAAYTDVADDPEPQPTALASDLIASGKRAILVIDNCPPELHRRLSERCRLPESLLSLMTVEYDIREDQPEGSEVYQLESSSTDLLKRLLKDRFPRLSGIDVQTVAESAGGNARIAIVLSETIKRNEAITGIADTELFKRLFEQRHGSSDSLLLTAQTLSLVYSFEGEDASTGEKAELFRLGTLIGKSALELFRDVVELQKRGLVQRRGPWRAVLPHALANKLAAMALEKIQIKQIEECILSQPSGRLLRSFSRRLGYLCDNKDAHSIVTKWLNPGGVLEDVPQLTDLGRAIFSNIAPVAPETTLAAFERAFRATNEAETLAKCKPYVHILYSLAYESRFFERCVALILKILKGSEIDSTPDEGRKAFSSLFSICYSGTHATIGQRLAIVKSLLISDEPMNRDFGIAALRAALEAVHFSPPYNFDFGTRSRDYGFWPGSREDVEQWFRKTLQLAETIACSNEPAALHVRTVVAEQFRGLWTTAAMLGDLEHLCRAVSTNGFWLEGWIAVRETIFYDSKSLNGDAKSRLQVLELALRPSDLVQSVRSIVLSERLLYVGLSYEMNEAGSSEMTIAEVESKSRDLGKAVAANDGAMSELLPELVSGTSQQLWSFGGGIAEASANPQLAWTRLVSQLELVAADRRTPYVFRGFLYSLNERNQALVESLLEDAVKSEFLAPWYPVLQTAVGIDERAVDRIIRSLEIGKAPVRVYRNLVGGGITHDLTNKDFGRLLLGISAKPEGFDIAIEILCMRIAFAKTASSPPELEDIACELFRQVVFSRRNRLDEYRLGVVAKNCLVGEKGATVVREICERLRDSVSRGRSFGFDHAELIQILMGVQPFAVLDGLCGGNIEQSILGTRILEEGAQFRRNPFDGISEAELIHWCDQAPANRYPVVSAGVAPFRWSDQVGHQEWTPIALLILERAPNRVEILKKFVSKFAPDSGAGSYATVIESNSRLLDKLPEYSDPTVRDFVAEQKLRIAAVVKAEYELEREIYKERDEAFE